MILVLNRVINDLDMVLREGTCCGALESVAGSYGTIPRREGVSVGTTPAREGRRGLLILLRSVSGPAF